MPPAAPLAVLQPPTASPEPVAAPQVIAPQVIAKASDAPRAAEPVVAWWTHPAPDLPARADALLAAAGEVEFLASIGLHHGAVQAMEQHLSAAAAPAPLAWLELVNLHRSEGNGGPATAAWHRLVAHFPAAATADAEALLDDAEGLEAFPAVLARVQATWSTPLATEQLAAELMAWNVPLLTLAAGRELLWLLQVCHERAAARPGLVPETSSTSDAFDSTVLFTAGDWVRHLEALEVTPRDQPAAVDIDLGVPTWIDAARASVRVSEPQKAAVFPVSSLDELRFDLFDAATGYEHRRPATRLDVMSR